MAGENANGAQAAGRVVATASGGLHADPRESGVPPTRATGAETATGMQIRAKSGQDIPKGKEAGSQVPIEGGDPTPDHEGPQKPRGLQAEPALFVSNGSVPHQAIASPSGLQGPGAVLGSPEEAKRMVDARVEEHKAFVERSVSTKRLDEATISRLGRAELAAIGLQRGYDIPEAGARATRAAFARGQDTDNTIEGGRVPKGSRKGSQQARGAKSTPTSMKNATKREAPKGGPTRGAKTATRRGGRGR